MKGRPCCWSTALPRAPWRRRAVRAPCRAASACARRRRPWRGRGGAKVGGVLPEGEERGEEGAGSVGEDEESVEQGVSGGSEGEGEVEQLVEHAEEGPHVGKRQRVLPGVGRPGAQRHQLVIHLHHHRVRMARHAGRTNVTHRH
jgi:hypothetical protein